MANAVAMEDVTLECAVTPMGACAVATVVAEELAGVAAGTTGGSRTCTPHTRTPHTPTLHLRQRLQQRHQSHLRCFRRLRRHHFQYYLRQRLQQRHLRYLSRLHPLVLQAPLVSSYEEIHRRSNSQPAMAASVFSALMMEILKHPVQLQPCQRHHPFCPHPRRLHPRHSHHGRRHLHLLGLRWFPFLLNHRHRSHYHHLLFLRHYVLCLDLR